MRFNSFRNCRHLDLAASAMFVNVCGKVVAQ